MKYSDIRFILWICLFIILFLLFNFWQIEHNQNDNLNNKNEIVNKVITIDKIIESDFINNEKKSLDVFDKIINVKTDVFNLSIDLCGGDIIDLSLSKYSKALDNLDGYNLITNDNGKLYVSQSGILSKVGPDSLKFGRKNYITDNKDFFLDEDKDLLDVLLYSNIDNINIIKKYIFKRNSYLVDIEYVIFNNTKKVYFGNLYARLKRQYDSEVGGFINTSRSYVGIAVNTLEKSYQKISFDDLKKNNFHQNIFGGWIAMVERYFFSSWIVESDFEYNYLTEKMDSNIYSIRFIKKTPIVVFPNERKEVKLSFFSGPEMSEMLKYISNGLELTVDYGILWPIARPIFLLLSSINNFVNNWGVSIIIVTLIIKMLFYHLSVSSYRSMGNMKKLQPRINILKERYNDDKTKFGHAIMELYKKEKINPLGGCLPILVQIPVFISLYYVLLESIDLRQAGFIFWINDLSIKDPYYILPVIMGITMFLQQKLTPTPPDPLQQKIMLFMPIVFTFLFLQFPAGLVLYWIVNNMLSILQQTYIMRTLNNKK